MGVSGVGGSEPLRDSREAGPSLGPKQKDEVDQLLACLSKMLANGDQNNWNFSVEQYNKFVGLLETVKNDPDMPQAFKDAASSSLAGLQEAAKRGTTPGTVSLDARYVHDTANTFYRLILS